MTKTYAVRMQLNTSLSSFKIILDEFSLFQKGEKVV